MNPGIWTTRLGCIFIVGGAALPWLTDLLPVDLFMLPAGTGTAGSRDYLRVVPANSSAVPAVAWGFAVLGMVLLAAGFCLRRRRRRVK